MEKLASPFSNVWRVFTLVGLVSGVFLLLYLNQDTTRFIPASSTMHHPLDPLAAERNSETLNGTLAIQNDETLKEDDGEGAGDDGGKGENDTCDIFDGRWVYDPANSPEYNATDCPFLSDQVNCQRNGRPDLDYERWNWEGSHCEIPRLNRPEMLERLRGTRVVIAGDSLNRNQFESLACLLYSSLPSSDSYVDVESGDYKIFRAKSYNCTVEFYWAPFLVEMEPKGQDGIRVLKLDQIHPSADKWRGANMFIFNTGHWWVHKGKFKAWDVIQYEGKTMEDMGMELAFERGMKTWSTWVDQNIDSSTTTVFFRSISPEHKGKDWCFHHTQPLMDQSYTERFPRIDAHPKIYTTKRGVLLTEDQKKQPEAYADCSHWCLPGVPDTWNRIMYTSFVLNGFGENSTFPKPTDSD